jgi:hypothetical protein
MDCRNASLLSGADRMSFRNTATGARILRPVRNNQTWRAVGLRYVYAMYAEAVELDPHSLRRRIFECYRDVSTVTEYALLWRGCDSV